jgi:ATP-dependent RNA helicase DDX5/DBP2
VASFPPHPPSHTAGDTSNIVWARFLYLSDRGFVRRLSIPNVRKEHGRHFAWTVRSVHRGQPKWWMEGGSHIFALSTSDDDPPQGSEPHRRAVKPPSRRRRRFSRSKGQHPRPPARQHPRRSISTLPQAFVVARVLSLSGSRAPVAAVSLAPLPTHRPTRVVMGTSAKASSSASSDKKEDKKKDKKDKKKNVDEDKKKSKSRSISGSSKNSGDADEKSGTSRTNKKKRSTEKDQLLPNDDDSHEREAKRLRAYSIDGKTKARSKNESSAAAAAGAPAVAAAPSRAAAGRPRTRSMDIAEGIVVSPESEEDNDADASSVKLSGDDWRKEHGISLRDSRGSGGDTKTGTNLDPFQTFADAPFDKRIRMAFQRAGFNNPTAIQAQAWPLALQDRDLISIARTGSGKTLGFLLPVFHRFLEQQKATGIPQGYVKPSLLVLAPTRELSVQILEEANKFGRALGIRCVCCYGGSPKFPQLSALERGVEVVIATPGRLNDLLDTAPRKCDLSHVRYLVLDEADKMLDMGFEPQIRSILQHLSADRPRQTLLFSATWPKEIQKLASEFLKEPIQVNVGTVNVLEANKDITQTIHVLSEADKADKLAEILTQLVQQHQDQKATAGAGDTNNTQTRPPTGGPPSVLPAHGAKLHDKVIVFVAKKVSCHHLAQQLWDDGFAVDSLHGDRPQWERTRVMNAFKSGQLRVLVATDVAARGLDVKDVGTVVNYDMPSGSSALEDYVHRIGRTGRAGRAGSAITFFAPQDKRSAGPLVQLLAKAGQSIPEELQAMVPRPRQGMGGGGRGGGRGSSYSYGRGGGGGGGRSYMGGFGGRGGGGGRGFGRGGGGRGGSRGGGFGSGRGYSR